MELENTEMIPIGFFVSMNGDRWIFKNYSNIFLHRVHSYFVNTLEDFPLFHYIQYGKPMSLIFFQVTPTDHKLNDYHGWLSKNWETLAINWLN